MSSEDHYNKLYSGNKPTFGGGRPEKIVIDITKYRSSGSVLELGAGEGRNSLFLAKQGFEVIAQDTSLVGLEKLGKIAKEKGLGIKIEIGDIRTLNPNRNFDIFVCTYVLHHLRRQGASRLIKHMKEQTNPDGLNVITTFTDNGDFYRNNPDTENFYPKAGELKELYSEWEILEYEEIETKALAKRPSGDPMLNITAKILARKPKK